MKLIKKLITLITLTHLEENKRELYDTRGFLSCVRVLSTDQKIQAEYYLSPQGNVKIEKYYDINSNHPYEAKKIILNHLGNTHFLNNETELGAFLLKQYIKIVTYSLAIVTLLHHIYLT